MTDTDTLPMDVALAPPHEERTSWDVYCPRRKCGAEPGLPCFDQYGRRLVVPPDGGKAIGYTRVSTLAKAVDDPTNLTKWKVRTTALGLLRRPDLMSRLSGIIATADDLDGYNVKRDINGVCDEAFEAAGGSAKASAGTALHALTEAADAGRTLEHVSPEDRRRVDTYRAAMAGYVPVRSEGFVVNDDYRSAGSYDRLWLCPDGRVRAGDLKSGAWDVRYPLGVTTQVAIYANGVHYDPRTGRRSPLDPEGRLDPTTGLLIHLPATGGCEVVPLDLTKGLMVAHTAMRVRDIRTWKPADFITTLEGANE